MMRFLIKGLLRDRSRSLLPVLMVSAGAFLTVFLYSYMVGAIGDMVDANARFDTGHVKLVTKAYKKLSSQMPNDLALLDTSLLLDKLRAEYPGMIWTARIRFGGLLDIPDEAGETRDQGPLYGLGINLFGEGSPENELLGIKKALVQGRVPKKRGEILMSEAFAQKLGVVPGESATLLGSTMYGSMAMKNFVVVGTVRFGMMVIDRSTIIADIEDVRAALDMKDAASEILGFARGKVYDDYAMIRLARAFNSQESGDNDDFAPLMMALSEQGGLNDMLYFSRMVGRIIVTIFVVAMSIVLWNAGLMNGIRRYGEIGVRLAMGEPKGSIYRAMMIESVCIGLVGSALGTVVGLAASYYLQYTGFDISSMMQRSSILISSVIRARVTPVSYFIGFIPGVFASLLGTMIAGIGIYKRQTSQLFKELEV